MTYVYTIDTDWWIDRNDSGYLLYASVTQFTSDPVDPIYTICDNMLIESGDMKDNWDIAGLRKYLVSTGRLDEEDELIDEDEAIFRDNVLRGEENLKRKPNQ